MSKKAAKSQDYQSTLCALSQILTQFLQQVSQAPSLDEIHELCNDCSNSYKNLMDQLHPNPCKEGEKDV